MKKVKEFMDTYSQDIIRELGKKEFNTTDVVSTINQRKEWQKEYIKLSEQYGSYNKLNAQIGRYLANNQKKMGICKYGGKEVSITNTGRRSPNQKWKVLLVPILLLFMNISTYAQTLIPQENSKSKWGYVNETGKVVIKYKYDEAREFSENLAAVSLKDKFGNKKSGFIDKTGKVIIPLTYDGIGDFSEGLARVKKVTKLGYIDKTGKEIIPVIYDGIDEFSEGLARVKREGKIGFIDKTGKEIIPVKYDATGLLFIEGIVLVKSGGKLGFIDKTGKEIIPVKYDEIGNFSEEGLAKVQNGGYWGFIDKSGKEIIPLTYNVFGEFSKEGLAKVKSGNYWGFIDKMGKAILPIEYNEIGEFSDGLAKVKKNEKIGFIDKTGKVIIPLKYDDAIDFSNGYAAYAYRESFFTYGGFVDTRTNWGIIDKTGQEVLLAEYTEEEVKGMLSDPALLKKKIEKEAEKEMLIEEVEAVLDNDYYSDNCHSVEVLDRLYLALDKLENKLPLGSEDKKYLSELKKDLILAYRQQVLTKKYGATTAKKIIEGKYEIGMSKEVVYEILSNNRGLDMRPYYEKSESSSSETWSLKWGVDSFDITIMDMQGIDRPTLIIRNGKLTNIIR